MSLELSGPRSARHGSRSGVTHRRAICAISVSLAILVAIFIAFRDGTPRLTRATLESSREIWNRNAPSSYRASFTIHSEGRGRAERFDVTVRDGKVESLRLDGADLPPNPAYSVCGLFTIIEEEFAMTAAAQPGSPFRGAALRARFDATLGYPVEFKRIASARQSTFIRMDEFVALAAGAEASPAR